MPGWLEQISGFLVLALVLLDVFLDVLYARLGTGILAPRISRMIWRLFLWASRPMGRHRRVAMSFCGPVILVALVVTWALGLTLGTALVIHPVLGTAVRASSGPTPTDFLTAMYVGGSSVSIVGGGNFSPQTGLQVLLPVQLAAGLVGAVAHADVPDADLLRAPATQRARAPRLPLLRAARGRRGAHRPARPAGAVPRRLLQPLGAVRLRRRDEGDPPLLPGALLLPLPR